MSKDNSNIFWIVLTVLLVLTAFGFGYFTANLTKAQKRPPVVVERQTDNEHPNTQNTALQEGTASGQVVSSVNSDKFHYLYCPGAKRIKEENKVYFSNAQEAMRAGLVLAGNCLVQ